MRFFADVPEGTEQPPRDYNEEGKTFTASSANAKGSSLYALTYDEVAAKFRGLADAVIGQRNAEEVIRAVGALDTIPDIRNLTKLLARYIPVSFGKHSTRHQAQKPIK